MELKRPGKLRMIHQVGDPSATSSHGVDFIIIPGLWNENSPGGMKGSCSWVRPLAESTTSDIRVYLFSYQLEIDGSSLWEQLLNQSYALIEGLDENRARPGYHLRPLLFICHSLGGLVLKKALTRGLRPQSVYLDATSGVIFLGTPQLVDPSSEGWNALKLLMKANRKEISRENMADYERDAIASTCLQFKALQLTIPILSAYEQRETKFKENIFARRLKGSTAEVLISQSMVQISSQREIMMQIDKSHVNLCDVEASDPLYHKLVEFFSSFIHHAPKNMQYSFRQVSNEVKNLNLRARSSISSFSEPSYNTPGTKIYTPSTGLSDQTEAGLNRAMPEAEADFDASLEEKIKLPFAFMSFLTRNPRFSGREDVFDQIDAAFGLERGPGTSELTLENPNGAEIMPKTYVLCGMAGIGKTETAMEYIYSRRDRFDAVIWVYADTTRKLGPQFVALAKELSQFAASDSTDETSAREIVKEWLAAPVGIRSENGRAVEVEATWLMVFDNADSPDVLYDWLPDQGPGCILVTSKYPYVKENSYRLDRGLDLETFPPEFGGAMLRKLSGREKEAGAVEASIRISSILGGLPLAIFQMSAIIRENHLTFHDFEDWYLEGAKELHSLRATGMQTSYQHTVGTAWAIEQLSAHARALIDLLSVFDPDRIPEEMLMDGSSEVAFPDYPKRKHHYFQARAELIHTSLITRNMATNEIRIHRLVQEVVRNKMENDDLNASCAAAAVLIGAVWPWVCGTDPTRNQASRVPIAERFTPHICKLEELFGSDLRGGEYNGTPMSGYIFSSYAWYISERGAPKQSEIFASLARIILERAMKHNPEEEKQITHWLGEAHHSASLAACLTGSSDGTKDANVWLGILEDRIQKYGEASDTLALATAYNQLGICLVNIDQIENAMESFRKSLATYESVNNAPQFTGTFPAISLTNLLVLQGQPDEAERIITPTLEDHERILGTDDVTTTESGHIWRAMGNVRTGQHRDDEALQYYERAVKNIQATLGQKHFFAGDCYYSLAASLIQLGDHERAINTLDSAISAFTAAPHREAQAARAIWKKGCLLKERDVDETYVQLFQACMELRHQLIPGDQRTVDKLEDKDWTDLVFYWSR